MQITGRLILPVLKSALWSSFTSPSEAVSSSSTISAPFSIYPLTISILWVWVVFLTICTIFSAVRAVLGVITVLLNPIYFVVRAAIVLFPIPVAPLSNITSLNELSWFLSICISAFPNLPFFFYTFPIFSSHFFNHVKIYLTWYSGASSSYAFVGLYFSIHGFAT